MTRESAMWAVAIMALVTMAIRFAPFVIFSKGRKTPGIITYLGKVLPAAIMGMLVVYCLKDMSFSSIGGFLPAVIAGTATACSFAWKKNTLLSIILGTAVYMILVRIM